MRDNNLKQYLIRVSSTGAETLTAYFSVGSRPIMVRHHVLTGINPAAVDADTVSSAWAYSVTGDGGGSWTTLNSVAAFEFNDTTDTNALGDIGDTTGASVNMNDDINLRVPAGAIIRNVVITAGTVTSLQMIDSLEYIVL
jgi:hypothetical protein